MAMAKHDSDCTLDYIEIAGASETCQRQSGGNLYNKICGGKFSIQVNGESDNVVCGNDHFLL